MTDYERVRAILDAATPGPWQQWYDDYIVGNWCIGPTPETAGSVASAVPAADARAIVLAHNLAPEWNAVAEAAQHITETAWPVACMPDLRAALDALHAKMKETLT